MSTAALAEVLWTMERWRQAMTASRSIRSMPMRAGAMKSFTAEATEAFVSPVMTAVGGASP